MDAEDEDFIAEFNRVIDDPELPHANRDEDDDLIEVDPDNYVDMIVARRREPEEPLEQARVKQRALNPEGFRKSNQSIGNKALNMESVFLKPLRKQRGLMTRVAIPFGWTLLGKK